MKNLNYSSKNAGASEREINQIESDMKVIFPNVYKEILRWTDGCIIDERILIYSTDEIQERNITMEVNEYADSYVAIGDDGGGLVILMKQETHTQAAILVDIGDMEPNDPYCIIHNIYDWMLEGCIIE